MTRSRDLANLADGVEFLAADHTKLDGIETAATADQTNAEIRTAVEAASDSNVFTDADHSKLNAIEASATADQTNAEIRAAVEAATDSNVFTDADHSKLNAVEASSDVTDTANVTAAGALMDSELTNLAAVKAINQSLVTTASPTFAGLGVNGTVTADGLTVNTGVNSSTRTFLVDNAHSGGSMYNAFGVYVGATDRLVTLSADYGESIMAFRTNGTERLRIGSTGILYVNGDGTGGRISGDGSGGLNLQDGNGRQTFKIMSPASGSTQALTLDASGNLLVGKNSTNSDVNGVELLPNGTVYITANNTLPFYINRRGTSGDNEFARFSDDGATRGKISSSFANELMVSASGTNSSGILFSAANQVRPMKNGSASDSTQDLGTGNGKWKDLYLSGGVFLGGIDAAHKLEDYEEGTWNITDGSGAGISFSVISGSNVYTKIGRMVFATVNVLWPSTANGGLARLVLPFNADPNGSAVGGVVIEQNYSSSVAMTASINYSNGVIFRTNGVSALTNANLSGKRLRFTVIYHAS